MQTTTLQINDLNIRFGSKQILSGLTTIFQSGRANGIYGFNGVGKSTLFNAIYGLIPFKGEIKLNEQPISRDDIGYLMTENFYYPNILASEHLHIFQHSTSTPIFDIIKLAELLGVPLDQSVESFSTGMKKKLSFLCVLSLNRSVYLLDEPFNGVDIPSTHIMKEIIRKLIEQSKIVMLTSHIEEQIKDLCDQILVIENAQTHFQIPKIEFEHYLQRLQWQLVQKVNSSLHTNDH